MQADSQKIGKRQQIGIEHRYVWCESSPLKSLIGGYRSSKFLLQVVLQ